MNPSFAVSKEARQFLEAQQITLDKPGSILGDIQILLDFIGAAGLRTTSAQGNLPSHALPELNRRLSQPVEINLQRHQLRTFPNIAGPYILLRVMGLVRTQPGRVRVGENEMAAWSGLNLTERYFSLMEAWLLCAEDSVLSSKRGARMTDQPSQLLRFLETEVSSAWRTYHEWIHMVDFGEHIRDWNAQLMARFGLIELQARSLESPRPPGNRGWIMEKARLTPWGGAAREVLLGFVSAKRAEGGVVFGLVPPEATYGFLRPAFQPWFPQLQRAYAPVQQGFRPGLYIFKVNLGRAWRRLAVPAHNTLEHLAQAILSAFDFDHDHLYDFKYRDQLGKAREFTHPFCAEGPTPPRSRWAIHCCRKRRP